MGKARFSPLISIWQTFMEALLSARLGAGSRADGMKEDMSFVLKELTNQDGDQPQRPAFNNSTSTSQGRPPTHSIALSLQTHPLASACLHFPLAPHLKPFPHLPSLPSPFAGQLLFIL